MDDFENAEEQLGFKLLLSTTGGKHGGGAQLTEQGEALLAAYARYCQTLRDVRPASVRCGLC